MSIRDHNLKKTWRLCLKCGRPMHTDRCHRLCRRCRLENDALGAWRTARVLDDDFKQRQGHDDLREWFSSSY